MYDMISSALQKYIISLFVHSALVPYIRAI